MPGGDGTGPAGLGPMTGGAAGFCAGYPMPGFMNPYGGRFWGRGRGGSGRGRRNRFYATGLPGWARAPWGYSAWGGSGAYGPYPYAGQGISLTAQQELDALKQQAEYLQGTLNEINQRVEELKTETEKEK